MHAENAVAWRKRFCQAVLSMPMYLFSSNSYAHNTSANSCKFCQKLDELCAASCPEQDEVRQLENTTLRGELTCHEHLCRGVPVPG